ncbi:MAG: tripartite tricarboxylate transporter substrate binding protein [Burkholderiales bacterium]|nr:tripartite tricarboxylate transporter substrate binding protein [Burkholderiales bacterium]
MMKKWIAATCAAFSLTAAGTAWAQEFPTRPIRFVVGYAAGGPTDVIARIVAQDVTSTLGQSVIVENKAGANGNIGTEFVARSPADGYTLIVNTLSHNVNPLLAPVKYDPVKDFAPVTLAAALPQVVVVGYDSPIHTMADLVARAKSSPGAVTFGSAGNGGSAHLTAALLEQRSGTKMTHVPFRGNAPALTEVVAGRVDFMFYPMIGVADLVNQKRVKVIGVTTANRHPDYPNVPTMAESGFPGFDQYVGPVGFMAPAGTPQPVIDKLAQAIRSSLQKPATVDRLRQLGAVVVASSPTEYRDWLKGDAERWAQLVKAANVKAE